MRWKYLETVQELAADGKKYCITCDNCSRHNDNDYIARLKQESFLA